MPPAEGGRSEGLARMGSRWRKPAGSSPRAKIRPMTVDQAIQILRSQGHSIEEQNIFLWNRKAYRVDGVYRFGDWLVREAETALAGISAN